MIYSAATIGYCKKKLIKYEALINLHILVIRDKHSDVALQKPLDLQLQKKKGFEPLNQIKSSQGRFCSCCAQILPRAANFLSAKIIPLSYDE